MPKALKIRRLNQQRSGKLLTLIGFGLLCSTGFATPTSPLDQVQIMESTRSVRASTDLNQLHKDQIWIDGPTLTLAELVAQVEHRSPYRITINANDQQKGQVKVNGLMSFHQIATTITGYFRSQNRTEIQLSQPYPNNLVFSEMKGARPVTQHLEVEVVDVQPRPCVPQQEEKVLKSSQTASTVKTRTTSSRSEFVFPKFTKVGLQGMAYSSQLKGFSSAGAQVQFRISSTYSRFDFNEEDTSLKLYQKGDYTLQELELSYWATETIEVTAGVTGGDYYNTDIDLYSFTASRSFFDQDKTRYDLGDTTLAIRQVSSLGKFLVAPEATVKVPVGQRENLISSQGVDYSLSIETMTSFVGLSMGAEAGYTFSGKMDVFASSVKTIDPEDFAYGSLAVTKTQDDISFSLGMNYQDNPLRKAGKLSAFDDALVSVGGLFKFHLRKFSIGLNPQAGLTKSSPDFSATISISGSVE